MKEIIIAIIIMLSFDGIRVNGEFRYIPQAKQKLFHDAILNRGTNGFRDFLYGGAAKGGKSESLRWEAHRNCLQYPRLRGLLIRSAFPELQRTHLSRIKYDLPPSVGRYNEQKHTFVYSDESVLEFGYGERESDFDQYLSAEYDFILIDELTTIPFDFSYKLRSRLAASRNDFIPFCACATNPGGIAHVDVRNYFVKKSNIDSDRFADYKSERVFFLPATVYDNQILLDRDPEVLSRLQQMSKSDQQKYLYGNWDIFEGQFFSEFFDEVHVIKPSEYLDYEQIKQFLVRAGMDYGNISAVEFMYRDYNGNVVVFDEWADKESVRSEKVSTLKKFLIERGLEKFDIEADTNLWLPDQFDVDNSNFPAMDFISAKINLIKVSKNYTSPDKNRGYRIACNDAIRDYLHWQNESGVMKVKPKLKIYKRCVHLLETMPTLITNPKDPEDIADGQIDHYYDAFKMGFMTLYTPREKPVDTRKAWQIRLAEKKKQKMDSGKNKFMRA